MCLNSTDKLSNLTQQNYTSKIEDTSEINELKLKIKSIEIQEKQLMDTILSGNLNSDMIELANQKASQLKENKNFLLENLEKIKNQNDKITIDFVNCWKKSNYKHKKAVASILIHQIIISEDGSTKVIWNI